jgi:hypothetical protein
MHVDNLQDYVKQIRFAKRYDSSVAEQAEIGLSADDFGGVVLTDKLTPMTPDEAAKAMSEAYKIVTGDKPTVKILALMLAQWALETGNGKFIHHYNYGNGKATKNSHFSTYFRCSEIIGGKEQFFDPPDPHCHFAAYPSAIEGAVAFVNLLKHRDNWWKGLHTGTPQGFVKGLSTQPFAYFTANVTLYQNVLTERYGKYFDVAKQYARPSIFWQVILGLSLAVSGVYGIKKLRS